jgi:hypothetical protein
MCLHRKYLKWFVFMCLTCSFGFVLQPALLGQATTGTISGVVSDGTAPVPGAVATARNLDTNATHSMTTEADGRFYFPGLPIGPYEITIEKPGFSKYKQGPIILLLNQVAVVDVSLKLSSISETITVTQDAPLLNTTTAEVGVRFDERRLSQLPLSGQFGAGGGFRDVFSVALSAPGVSQTSSGNATFSTGTNFSVNGMRLRGNNFQIDGQDSNDPSVAGRQQQMNNPDIVQEFRLITNQFNAEYGRSAGSVVNVITKSGTNGFHGSAFWYHDDNALNTRSNLEKKKFTRSPKNAENQEGGTFGGPIRKDHTFFFVSAQKWTQRALGAGNTLSGAPTDSGRAILQSTVGSRPQVQALLKFVPAGTPNGKNAFFCNGGTGTPTGTPPCSGGTLVAVPLGDLTGSAGKTFDDWQWSARIDHRWKNHVLGGRHLYDDRLSGGNNQVTPPGLTDGSFGRTQATMVYLTSNLKPNFLNDLRLAYQRFNSTTNATDPASESIPSLEISELGMTGFNAGTNRKAIGLAVNLPQFRFNNTYQIQDTVDWIHGSHSIKFGADLRRIDVKSFFFPTIRGLLRYTTLDNFVKDFAEAANINKPLPGGSSIQYYKWYDYFFFIQDTWQLNHSFTLNYGLRYEAPGNALASLYPVSDAIRAGLGGDPVFSLDPRPGRPTNNIQPRLGFAWNPHTSSEGWLGHMTGGDKLVLRGGYSRTNDYAFINIALNVASSFPFVGAISNSKLQNAFTTLPGMQPSLTPTGARTLTRTIVANDFRSPIAEQFALELQRELRANTVAKIGWIGTKGTALFQTLDGNPRTRCSPIPVHRDKTNGNLVIDGCPRVDPTRGVVRLRANAASSIYRSLQASLDKRFSHGFGVGAHYTWSAFIDSASEVFNPSSGEVATPQDPFNPNADRGRSTYDRPHRFTANFVWELPWYREQVGAVGHILGGWQISTFTTFQSGTPFTILNGSDPGSVLAGIDSLVGNSVRPNVNTNLNVSKMSLAEILAAGGASLWAKLDPCPDSASALIPNKANPTGCVPVGPVVGNSGRNTVRASKLKDINISFLKSFKLRENHQLQFRADFFNATNTQNLGIPEGRVNANGFLDDTTTDGGNRRIFLSLRYAF